MPISWPNHILQEVCMLIELSNLVSSCKTIHAKEWLLGFGCVWDNAINLIGVVEHECVLSCVSDKSCKAVNYDAEEDICMKIELPCPMLEVRQRQHYQILATVPEEGCVQWVTTHDWSYPRMVKYNHTTDGSRLHVVVRFTAAGELLPAKWPPTISDTENGNIKAYTVQDNSIISKNAFDVLVVNVACSLLWVDYDASSGNSMPPGAVVGGHLADEAPL